jgi:hypothetical protein
MKTFGLFMLIWLASVLASFNIWKGTSENEMLEMIFATQFAYIMYRLVKEENKD